MLDRHSLDLILIFFTKSLYSVLGPYIVCWSLVPFTKSLYPFASSLLNHDFLYWILVLFIKMLYYFLKSYMLYSIIKLFATSLSSLLHPYDLMIILIVFVSFSHSIHIVNISICLVSQSIGLNVVFSGNDFFTESVWILIFVTWSLYSLLNHNVLY